MREILDGPPQFILLVLVTGMIAWYSGVLNKIIAKKKKLGNKADDRLSSLSLWLTWSEIVLLIDGYLIVARILLSIFQLVHPMLDLVVMIIFTLAHILLSVVFALSYFWSFRLWSGYPQWVVVCTLQESPRKLMAHRTAI